MRLKEIVHIIHSKYPRMSIKDVLDNTPEGRSWRNQVKENRERPLQRTSKNKGKPLFDPLVVWYQ